MLRELHSVRQKNATAEGRRWSSNSDGDHTKGKKASAVHKRGRKAKKCPSGESSPGFHGHNVVY